MSDEFVAGSVILCWTCAHPVYALERGLGPLDRGGRGADAFRPLQQADLDWLLSRRPDIPRWWQDKVRAWLRTPAAYRTLQAARPRPYDDTVCPNCGGYWTQYLPRDGHAVHERGQVLLLKDIPPSPTRHRQALKWLADPPEHEPEITIEKRPYAVD